MPRPPLNGPITSQARKRLLFISFSVLGFLALLVLQFYRLQIVQGEKWTKIARSQHQIVITEPFKRGVFFSNTSLRPSHPMPPQMLVCDIPYFHLCCDPLSIPPAYHKGIVQELERLLNFDEKTKQELSEELNRKNHNRRLLSWLDKASQEKVVAWWSPFARKHKIASNALFFIQDYKRSYPYGKLFGSVLHTLRETHDALKQESIPTGGLELYFNKFLQGKQGKRLLFRSPKHPMDSGKVISYPENGADIYLTINHHLQAIAEDEVEKAVKKAGGRSGWAVLMDPYTGEIYALAQYPSFDPTHYKDYFNDPKLLNDTKLKAITDPYEPGSIMKPITLVISLMANKELKAKGKKEFFSPEEKIAVRDGRFPGRKKPITDVKSHNYLNMDMGIQKSSNIYVARIAQRMVETLGPEWYRKKLHTVFGFSTKTGIEIPAESSGFLPTPGKTYKNGALEWSTPTPFSLAMGYNLLATSLQMVRAYAIIANGGFDVKPTLVRKISRRNLQGEEEVLLDQVRLRSNTPPKRLIDGDIIQRIKQAMRFTTKKGGSASLADIFGYTEAGKTGTAEKIVNGAYSKDHHISSFLGFAPVDNPRFVLLVSIDEPEKKIVDGRKNQLGGGCAAPAFREIGTKTLQYLGVEPDDPFGYPAGDPRRDETKANLEKEIKELKALYTAWNS